MVGGAQHPSLEEALVAHRTARLNVSGRQLLVSRIELEGWPAAKAAEAQGVSRTTAHKWLRRYRDEGWSGLADRTSRPRRSPRSTWPEVIEAILRARVERRWGPHRLGPLLGQPRSTVYAVLARTSFSRLRDADRLSGVPVRSRSGPTAGSIAPTPSASSGSRHGSTSTTPSGSILHSVASPRWRPL